MSPPTRLPAALAMPAMSRTSPTTTIGTPKPLVHEQRQERADDAEPDPVYQTGGEEDPHPVVIAFEK